jgi:hypothetical protein
MPDGGIGTNLADQLIAIEFGKLKIKDDQIRMMFSNQQKCLFAVSGVVNIRIERLQDVQNNFTKKPGIVNDKQLAPLARNRRRSRGRVEGDLKT